MIKSLVVKVLLKCRKIKYSFYSNNSTVNGVFISHQPIVLRGKGQISVGENVNIGVINAPLFYNSYGYLEARNENSTLIFGNNIHINNNFSVVSEKSIIIKDNVLIGFNCNIIDSNFHNLEIDKRFETDSEPSEVIIENNVFIGNNVTILKGVTIGENSIVANGSMVTKSCLDNVIIAGVPAKELKKL